MHQKNEYIKRPSTVAVVGKHSSLVEQSVENAGFKVVKTKPQMVVTFGGDGTILKAERLFPQVPKLCARFSAVCLKCGVGVEQKPNPANRHVSLLASYDALNKTLEKIASMDKVEINKEDKLAARVVRNGKTVFSVQALNEVQVHNHNPLHAVRGTVRAAGRTVGFIGDGVIVATSFGSTGYFHSVSRQTFDNGMGIAFNNPVRPIPPLFLNKANPQASITMERHNGLFLCDNSPDTFVLEAGDTVQAVLSKNKARFVKA